MNFVQLASFFMFLAVALGAFGAHALREKLDPHYLDVYKTAVLYHFIHAFGLFVVAWLKTQSVDPRIQTAGIFLTLGIILFSGSLYALAITKIKIFGAITPLGGLCFLTGWTLIFLSSK